MLDLLKSDAFKIWKSRNFRVAFLFSAALGAFVVALLQSGATEAEEVAGRGAGEMLAEVLVTGIHLAVAAIFVGTFITADFQHGTIKNALSRGATRVNTYGSKVLAASTGALALFAVYVIAFQLTGTILWGFDPNGVGVVGGLLAMVGLHALLVVAYTTVFAFIAMSLRSTVGAVVTNAAVLALTAPLLGAVSDFFSESFSLSDYWIGWAVANLATITPARADVIHGVLVALVWGIATTAAGTALFTRTDVE